MKQTKQKLSKFDLLDKFKAFESEATYTDGNKSTHQMIAMPDVEVVIDELIEKYGHQGKRVKYIKLI
jgi:hypothetical protein